MVINDTANAAILDDSYDFKNNILLKFAPTYLF